MTTYLTLEEEAVLRRSASPAVSGPVGFGRYQDLGHTVQVALRRVCAWSGIRRAPKRARPVPSLERDEFRSRTRLRAGDTPDRGGRWTTTGKQRRNMRARTPDLFGRSVPNGTPGPDTGRQVGEAWRDRRSASGSRPTTTRRLTPRRAKSSRLLSGRAPAWWVRCRCPLRRTCIASFALRISTRIRGSISKCAPTSG